MLGMLGMHGTRAANHAVQDSDLLIVVGARFDDRATGKLAEFAPNAGIVHFDIDASEIGKLRSASVAVVGELREGIEALTQRMRAGRGVGHSGLGRRLRPLRRGRRASL